MGSDGASPSLFDFQFDQALVAAVEDDGPSASGGKDTGGIEPGQVIAGEILRSEDSQLTAGGEIKADDSMARRIGNP